MKGSKSKLDIKYDLSHESGHVFYRCMDVFINDENYGKILQWTIRRMSKFFDYVDTVEKCNYEFMVNMGLPLKFKYYMIEKLNINKAELRSYLRFVNNNKLFKDTLIITKYNAIRERIVIGRPKDFKIEDNLFNEDKDTSKYFYSYKDIMDKANTDPPILEENNSDDEEDDVIIEDDNEDENIEQFEPYNVDNKEIFVSDDKNIEPYNDEDINNNTIEYSDDEINDNVNEQLISETPTTIDKTIINNTAIKISFDINSVDWKNLDINIKDLNRKAKIEDCKYLLNNLYSKTTDSSFFENLLEVYAFLKRNDIKNNEVKSKILSLRETISYKPRSDYYDIKLSANNILTVTKSQFNFRITSIDNAQYNMIDLIEPHKFAFITPEDVDSIFNIDEYDDSIKYTKILYNAVNSKVVAFNTILYKHLEECRGVKNRQRYDLDKLKMCLDYHPTDYEELQRIIGSCTKRDHLVRKLKIFIKNNNTHYSLVDSGGRKIQGHARQSVIFVKDKLVL